MEKTSIKDLYPNVNNFKVMDIETVQNMLNGRNREVKLNIHENIKKDKRIEKLINKSYDKIYDMCIERINEASSFKKTDTIFKIPRGWKDYSAYSMQDCADHIVTKLKQENILCTRLGDSLFITWQHIK